MPGRAVFTTNHKQLLHNDKQPCACVMPAVLNLIEVALQLTVLWLLHGKKAGKGRAANEAGAALLLLAVSTCTLWKTVSQGC